MTQVAVHPVTTIGIDVGDKKSHLCLLDGTGAVVKRTKISTTRLGVEKFFGDLPPLVVALEVGQHSRWVSAILRRVGHDVIVANPRKLRLIYASQSKNDHNDAEVLARLARVDRNLLGGITHRSQAAQDDLAVVRARAALVRARTKLINHVRATVKLTGDRVQSCTAEAFPKRARVALPTALRTVLEPLLVVVDGMTQLIRSYDKTIENTAASCYPETDRLRAVDGVGPITALTFVLTLEDPKRFKKARAAGAYIGLVPRQDESGDISRQLRITKAGDVYLRQLLVGSAQRILGPFGKESELRTFGLKLCARGGKNAKKRAAVAVARKLAVLLCRLWTSGDEWVPVGYRAAAQGGADS